MTDQPANKTPTPAKMVEIDLAGMGPGLAAYANNLIAQFDGKAVHLTFAQINPPLIFGTSEEEKQRQLERIASVSAMPVARLVVPLDDCRNMVRVLQEQLNQIDKLINP